MKTFSFKVRMNAIGYGYVTAKNIKEAQKKIMKEEYDDISDIQDYHILDIEELEEDEE
jgi:hypothetical protein